MLSILQKPPRLAQSLLARIVPQHLQEPMLGDLDETFYARQAQHNVLANAFWYWRQSLLTSIHFINDTQKAVIMFIISVGLFLTLTLFAMALGGEISMFIDVPSMLLTLLPAALFTIGATSWKTCKLAIKTVMSGDMETNTQAISSLRVFTLLGNSIMWLGILMTVLGWISMGAFMEDLSVFGPAFAVSMLTVFYALIVKTLCYVAIQRITFLQETLSGEDL